MSSYSLPPHVLNCEVEASQENLSLVENYSTYMRKNFKAVAKDVSGVHVFTLYGDPVNSYNDLDKSIIGIYLIISKNFWDNKFKISIRVYDRDSEVVIPLKEVGYKLENLIRTFPVQIFSP